MVFGIDDSQIDIEGRPHTIIAAMGVRTPLMLESALTKLKAEFGLKATDEIKWNGMPPMSQKVREQLSQELMILLHESVPLVTITEGRDKKVAAERSVEQIAEFISMHPYSLPNGETVELLFDEEIIEDEREFERNLRALYPPPLETAQVNIVHSHEHAVIQLADVLAGFNRCATEIALGRKDKQIMVWDDGMNSDIQMSLLGYISIGLRWSMWGAVPSPPDPNNVTFDANWPFKSVGGYGVRIHSSIPPGTVDAIYQSRRVYMGCMH